MPPTPISPSDIHIILRYIAPPSQLTQPLPPHIVSNSLLQRHHFLQLSPDNPQEYLCWPDSSDAQYSALDLLEHLPRPIDDDEPVTYPVQYTSDDEHAYAHVAVSPDDRGVRLVFEWDERDGWKYHNAALMPFPPGSRSAVQPVLERFGDEQSTVPAGRVTSNGDESNRKGNEDDDYWNAYGSQEDDAFSGDGQYAVAKDTEAGTEDAYWARYASVHGSADSTQPSPPPQPKRKLHVGHSPLGNGTHSPNPLPVAVRASSYESYEDALPIPPSAIIRPSLHSKWDPASPRALAQRLASVLTRQSPSPSPIPIPDEAGFGSSDDASPTVGGSNGSLDSEILARSRIRDMADEGPLVDSSEQDLELVRAMTEGSDRSETALPTDDEDVDIEALRESIRGTWKLWSGRRRLTTMEFFEHDARLFLEVAREVIGSS